MKTNDYELIKQYLLEDKSNIKLKISIAWEIHQNWNEIVKEYKVKFIKQLKKLIKEGIFKDYKLEEFGFEEGKGDGHFVLYKPSWHSGLESDKKAILNYLVGADYANHVNVYYGINKLDGGSSKPFPGAVELGADQKDDTIEQKIFRKLCAKGDWGSTKWMHAWNWFGNDIDDMNKKEFLMSLFDDIQSENTVKFMYGKLVELKEDTETLIDEFCIRYKETHK